MEDAAHVFVRAHFTYGSDWSILLGAEQVGGRCCATATESSRCDHNTELRCQALQGATAPCLLFLLCVARFGRFSGVWFLLLTPQPRPSLHKPSTPSRNAALGFEQVLSQVAVHVPGEGAVINMPMDVCFKTTNMHGWPRVVLSVYGESNLQSILQSRPVSIIQKWQRFSTAALAAMMLRLAPLAGPAAVSSSDTFRLLLIVFVKQLSALNCNSPSQVPIPLGHGSALLPVGGCSGREVAVPLYRPMASKQGPLAALARMLRPLTGDYPDFFDSR